MYRFEIALPASVTTNGCISLLHWESLFLRRWLVLFQSFSTAVCNSSWVHPCLYWGSDFDGLHSFCQDVEWTTTTSLKKISFFCPRKMIKSKGSLRLLWLLFENLSKYCSNFPTLLPQNPQNFHKLKSTKLKSPNKICVIQTFPHLYFSTKSSKIPQNSTKLKCCNKSTEWIQFLMNILPQSKIHPKMKNFKIFWKKWFFYLLPKSTRMDLLWPFYMCPFCIFTFPESPLWLRLFQPPKSTRLMVLWIGGGLLWAQKPTSKRRFCLNLS